MPLIGGKEVSRAEIEASTGRLDQVGGIRRVQFTEGRAKGLDALEVRTGSGLELTLLEGRNLDISHAFYQGISVCWRSQTGDAAPAYCDTEGDEWLRTFFGGLLTTCGLTNFGPPASDRFGLTGQHGRINTLPSENVYWSERWEDENCLLEVKGETRESKVLAENLVLRRRVETQLGASSFNVHDEVVNLGDREAPHMILYHCNAGFPLLSSNSRLFVSHRSVRPRDAEASKGIKVWGHGGPPERGFSEQVFIHEPVACKDGLARALMVNEHLLDGVGIGLCIAFDPEQLPAFFNWRMLGRGTYVMGMEPANCPVEGRENADREGVLPFLQPGETRQYQLRFKVLKGQSEIQPEAELIEEANRQYGV